MENYLYTKNNFNQNQNPFWLKYESLIQKMSKEEINFVAKQESVIKAKESLISVFIDYLFEKEKNNFILTELSKSVTENYLTEIEKASTNYISRAETLENENILLKKKIEELLKGTKNDDTTTK